MGNAIWTLIGLLILFWIIGFVAKIGGAVIHFLLVIALILFIFNLIVGRNNR